ncbi:MAG: tol-pal system-associated acyl-CoA thioesterase [Pseudomonadota bacterium]
MTDATEGPDAMHRGVEIASGMGLDGRLTTDGGHVLAVRIYFEDTDFAGIVYHANYLRYMERGRSDFLRLRGINHTDLMNGATGESLVFVVRHMDIDFVRPARIDDVIEVHTKVSEMRGARLILDQEIVKDHTLMTRARVTIALSASDGRPRRIPDLVRGRLGVPSRS